VQLHGERQTAPLFALHDDAESERLILVMPCYRIIRNRRKLTTLFFLFSRTRQSKPFSHAISPTFHVNEYLTELLQPNTGNIQLASSC